MLLLSVVSECKLSFPKEVDFGEVPAGNKSTPNNKMLSFEVVNNTLNIYTINDMKVKYIIPDSIMSPNGVNGSGNVIGFIPGHIVRYHNELKLYPGDKAFFPVAFMTSFVDDISKNGGFLEVLCLIFYKDMNSDTEIIDTVRFRAKAIENSEVLTSGYYFNGVAYCPSEETKGVTFTRSSVNLINNTDTSIIIDSVSTKIEGDNISILGWYDSTHSQLINPDTVIVLPGKSIRYGIKIGMNKFEESKFIITYYLRNSINNYSFTKTDSTVFVFRSSPQNGKISSIRKEFVANKIGDNPINSEIYILTCNNINLTLTDIFFDGEILPEEFSIPFLSNLPMFMNSDKMYSFNMSWSPKQTGDRRGKIFAKFIDENENVYYDGYHIRTYVGTTNSAIYDFEIDNPPFICYPNPVINNLSIKYNAKGININNYNITLYDVYGNTVFKSIIDSEYSNYDLSGLTSGIYLMRITGDRNVFSQKIIISK